MRSRAVLTLFAGLMVLGSQPAWATVYDFGVSPSSAGLTFGDHLVSPAAHPSVAGGASGIDNAGDALNGSRTYTYDLGAAPDLADGVANRGDTGFAMLIWDMGTQYDSIRLYTHQDHYNGGPINDDFTAQDVMEYSVWGSNDGDGFVLLSDVTAFDLNGGAPTYTFAVNAPTVVYRGGSTEFGTINAYTRDYTFSTSYRYYGVRTSTISLAAGDADPEIDAVGAYDAVPEVPEPGTLALLGTGLVGFATRRRRRS